MDEISRRLMEVQRMMEGLSTTAPTRRYGTHRISPTLHYGFSISVVPDPKLSVRCLAEAISLGEGRMTIPAKEPLIETVVDEQGRWCE